MDTNVITTQPPVFTNNAEPNLVENESNVITTQPLLNDPNDEELKKKSFSQFNPTMQKPPETRNQASKGEVAESMLDSCTWCCFACTDCAVTGCDCMSCCDDCCTACCESGPSADTIDGDDVAGCLECCGSCFELCNSCCSN